MTARALTSDDRGSDNGTLERGLSSGPIRGGPADWVWVAAALAATALLIWLATRQPLLVLVYAGAVVALGAVAMAVAQRRPVRAGGDLATPDWSVTVAVIEGASAAIAVTDRAGRLVCANRLFESAFDAAAGPLRLGLDAASQEALAEAMRAAWRDGKGAAGLLRRADAGTEGGARKEGWRCTVDRAGRGQDHLVWRFSPVTRSDPLAELVERTVAAIHGDVGRVLAMAGIATAVVHQSGAILAANAAFVEGAFGDPGEDVIGKDFVTRLERDEAGRLCWARDQGRGHALAFRHVPIALAEPVPPDAPALMLLAPKQSDADAVRATRAAMPHLEALLDNLPHGIAMADRDGRLLFANAAFMRAAGQDGKPLPAYPTDFVIREDKGALSEAVRRHGNGPVSAGDIAVRLIAQADEPVSLSLAGVRGLGDAAVLLGLTDTTEAARLRRQVEQATKMQAVGQLAGGVAHDFNNMLTAILGTCDLMLLRHMPGDSNYDDIQQIRANTNRAAALTRQLLAFSRQQTLRPQVLQLPDLLAETVQLLKRLIGEKIEFVVTHDRELSPVRADPAQLQQVLVNLVVNARDAIQSRGEGRGRIRVLTRRITVAGDLDHRGSEIVPAGEYAALVVEDNGGGILPEHQGKIFEPFFTTKETGKGTGLGLSTVYGFVKQSGGFVFADSTPGEGTRFTVYLPAHRGPVSAPPAPTAAPPRKWSREARLLLVEDEDTVRMVAERALAREGYAVTTARDGEEGLDLVRAGGSFDLVISDVVMPVMDGPAMAREIRAFAPDLPVLFMSGYAEEQLRREIDIENVEFIAKPFSVQQISEKVSGILGRG